MKYRVMIAEVTEVAGDEPGAESHNETEIIYEQLLEKKDLNVATLIGFVNGLRAPRRRAS